MLFSGHQLGASGESSLWSMQSLGCNEAAPVGFLVRGLPLACWAAS